MSNIEHTKGGNDSCCCPDCNHWFPCDVGTVKEGHVIQCTNCKHSFEIRYMDVDVTYYLDPLDS